MTIFPLSERARMSPSLLCAVCFCCACHRGPVLLEDDQRAGSVVLLINWLQSSFHSLKFLVFLFLLFFLNHYCCISLKHLTSSLLRIGLLMGNTGIIWELAEIQNFGGSHPIPSSACCVVLVPHPTFALLKAVYFKRLCQLHLLGSFLLGCVVYRRYPWSLGVTWRWGWGPQKPSLLASLLSQPRSHCQIQCHEGFVLGVVYKF